MVPLSRWTLTPIKEAVITYHFFCSGGHGNSYHGSGRQLASVFESLSRGGSLTGHFSVEQYGFKLRDPNAVKHDMME